MKKIIAFVLAALLMLSLAGCGGNAKVDTPTKLEDPKEKGSVNYKDYPDTLEGLCEYMADMGYGYDFEDGKKGKDATDPVYMKADLIGAESGYKYSYTYDGKNGVLELYHYTDTDNQWYKQIKEEGKLTISDEIEGGTVDAILSSSGKYVMIHSYDSKNDDRINAAKEVFLEFYPEGSAEPTEPEATESATAENTATEPSAEQTDVPVTETPVESNAAVTFDE